MRDEAEVSNVQRSSSANKSEAPLQKQNDEIVFVLLGSILHRVIIKADHFLMRAQLHKSEATVDPGIRGAASVLALTCFSVEGKQSKTLTC